MRSDTHVSEFAKHAIRYETDRDASLLAHGVATFRVRAPVSPPVADTLQTAVAALHGGAPLSDTQKQAVGVVAGNVVAAYERDLVAASTQKPALLAALLPIEQKALHAFVTWAFQRAAKNRSDGTDVADLDRIADGTPQPGETGGG